MKIMTFNTQHCCNFLENKIDFQIMADAIKQCDPDIVGLNEMRGLGSDPDYTDQVKNYQSLPVCSITILPRRVLNNVIKIFMLQFNPNGYIIIKKGGFCNVLS